MKHQGRLYVSLTAVGIVLLIIFLPNPIFFPMMNLFSCFSAIIGSVIWTISISCFSSIVGTVFLAAGLCGIRSQYFKNSQNLPTSQPELAGKASVKHSRLYAFIAGLGTVFLGMILILAYLGGHSPEVTRFFMFTPYGGFLMFIVFLFGGTGLLTVGICGTVRRYFRSNQNLFSMLVAIAVPSLILLPFIYLWIGALEVGL